MARAFRQFGIITIVAVYLLILVGGIVRSTGSGMGCPDWPKCFGQWIPPTDISQLPPDYKTIFKVQGKEIADFDPFKTWVEYLNRLLGVLIGLFIFITLLLSASYFRRDRAVFYAVLAAFLMTGFQGWLGSVVVSTNLAPFMITLHMVVALLIVAVLIYAISRAHTGDVQPEEVREKNKLNLVLGICALMGLSQIVLGTQLREAIDHIAAQMNYLARETWIEQIGLPFYIHRTYSLVILAAHLYLVFLLRKNIAQAGTLSFWANVLVGLIAGEIVTGAVMAYFAIPAVMQPVHLLLASLMFGVQILLALFLNREHVFKSATFHSSLSA
ncbi:COX15/CtaA family protein [Rhodoflexus caldus]|uniref:COX15/CtaA family protein n=1 Tax=Rhodoflexus caldus TaxID=2891236 RepID=UPI002029E4BE|nr:COX15/CtaA family protein [Rhodoflexus caldus]